MKVLFLSALAMVLSGIPQVSVLGPLLFVIFVNEMPELVHSCILMFVADTKIFTEIHDEDDAKRLHSDLTAPQDWSQKWQLKFNPDKCQTLHLGQHNDKYNYTMAKEDQEPTTTQRLIWKRIWCARGSHSVIQCAL